MSSRTSRAVKRHNKASKHKHHESHLPQPNTEGADGEMIAVAQPSMLSRTARKYKLQIMIAAPILLILMVLSTTTYLNYSSKTTTPVAYGQFFAALDNSRSNASDFNLNKAYSNAKNAVDPQTADFLTYIMGLIKYEDSNLSAQGLDLLNSITSEPYRSLARGYIADATNMNSDSYNSDTAAKGSTTIMMANLWEYRMLVNGDGNDPDVQAAQMAFVKSNPDSKLATLLNIIVAGEQQ